MSLDLKFMRCASTRNADKIFRHTVKQSQVHKLKSKKGQCTDEEWKAILEAILLQQESDLNKSEVLEGIEVGATVEEGVAVDIIFKRSISGITVRVFGLSICAC